MAFSTFNSISSLKKLKTNASSITQTVIATTSISSGNNTSLAFGISKSGQSIVYVNNSKHLYVSTNYGVSFSQKNGLNNFTQGIDYICISDNGQYVLANVYNSVVYKSSNSGSSFNTVPNSVNRFITMNSSGQYQIAMRGDTQAYMSNNNGDTWINLDSKITVGDKEIGSNQVIVPAISSSGQYVSFIVNSSVTPTVAFWYSTDHGNTFNYIYVDNSSLLYGRGFYMSNDCTKFIGYWAGKKVGIANGYPTPNNEDTTVTYASPNIDSNFTVEFPGFFVTNHDGSDIYFCNNSTSKIQKSVDNLQSSTDYGTELVSGAQGSSNYNKKGIIYASANCKYILTYIGDPTSATSQGKLYLTVNNTISENIV